MVHMSLDVVDEKISAMGKALVDQRELYLGLLYPTEDYKVYPSHLVGASQPAVTPREVSRLEIPPPVSKCPVGSADLERHNMAWKERRALNQQGIRAA